MKNLGKQTYYSFILFSINVIDIILLSNYRCKKIFAKIFEMQIYVYLTEIYILE